MWARSRIVNGMQCEQRKTVVSTRYDQQPHLLSKYQSFFVRCVPEYLHSAGHLVQNFEVVKLLVDHARASGVGQREDQVEKQEVRV
jgi:hypothetical protein